MKGYKEPDREHDGEGFGLTCLSCWACKGADHSHGRQQKIAIG